MNIARQICTVNQHKFRFRNLYRKFRFSSTNYESTPTSQPKVQEEKFDFEDLQVLERTERRKDPIPPFMKNVFVSIFNRDLLAFPEIINKDETEDVERRIKVINLIFTDAKKTKEDRREVLKRTKMFRAPVSLTKNGLASNCTESLRFLEVIGEDFELGQEISDHWVGLEALKRGLTEEQFNGVVSDMTSGDKTIALCIKEKVSERLTQADFRSKAEMDSHGVWRVTGEKVCSHNSGYLLVLATVEATRLKAFLVHPDIPGVKYDGKFIQFMNTPATPLDHVTEGDLARVLSLSRLYAATLCRTRLGRATRAVMHYVTPRAFAGKPLSELSTIRSTVGAAMVDMYACESAEYFTAGLLDGYRDADAELEAAMCRNFMANHGLTTLLKLLAIPALDQEEECARMLQDMRHLVARGESLDSVNIYIALTGVHHAGSVMADEIKQIRNPLLHPTFIIKKAFKNRHQEKDDPKLDLYLAEHLHPSLRLPSEQLEYCVLRLRYACETLMSRHGKNVAQAYTELTRLAEAGTEILAMTAVLGRASRAYCIGLRNAEIEMKLAACFVEQTKDKVKKLILEIDDGEYLNLDHFRIEFGRKILDTDTFLVEKPTARVFW